MYKIVGFTIVALCFAVLAQGAEDGNAPGYSLSPVRLANLKATGFVCKSVETTYQQLGPVTADLLKDLQEKCKKANIAITGGPIFVFKDPTADTSQPVTVEIGLPVAPGMKAPDGYQLENLESVRSETAVFTGSMKKIGQAIADMFEQTKQVDNQPAGTVRQRILYWEDEASENNIVLIEIPLRGL